LEVGENSKRVLEFTLTDFRQQWIRKTFNSTVTGTFVDCNHLIGEAANLLVENDAQQR
jgi:hypothetical protein